MTSRQATPARRRPRKPVSTAVTRPEVTKPPYRVPGMAEITAIPWNGYTVVSTFSGCGGSCLGLRMAGYRVAWASEFIPAARDTYRANAPHTHLDERDIRQVGAEDILEATGLQPGELDIFEGSPPCASFSTAGKREAGWGLSRKYSDTTQRTDDLFFEYCRLIESLQPRVFLAENVSGLVKGVAKGYFKEILARMKRAGYVIEARMLDASWLGVPQARQRIFFQGIRADLAAKPAWPKPLPYRYSVRDALEYVIAQGHLYHSGDGWYRPADRPSPTLLADTGFSSKDGHSPEHIIVDPQLLTQRGPKQPVDVTQPHEPAPTLQAYGLGNARGGAAHQVAVQVIHDTSGQRSQGDITDQPAPTITTGVNSVNSHHFQVASTGLTHDPETGEDITIGRYAIGREWERMRPGAKSDRYLNLVRPDQDRPLPTATADAGQMGLAGVTHWAECRKLTLLELRRLGGFPDDFELTGSYGQRWERIGRAVPPVMMFHLAAAVRDQVLGPLREQGRI